MWKDVYEKQLSQRLNFMSLLTFYLLDKYLSERQKERHARGTGKLGSLQSYSFEILTFLFSFH